MMLLSSARARIAVARLSRYALVTPAISRHLATVCGAALASRGAEIAENYTRRHDYNGALMALACAAAAGTAALSENKTSCCGISGVVGKPSYDAREFLLESLMVLKNRGYDSAGLATMPSKGGQMVRNYVEIYMVHTASLHLTLSYLQQCLRFLQSLPRMETMLTVLT